MNNIYSNTLRWLGSAILGLLFLLSPSSVEAAKEVKLDGVIEGYFTQAYVRESENDMPRRANLLIDKDGKITQLAFERYSSKNRGEYSAAALDPESYLGKHIAIDFIGVTQHNNKEFVYYEGKKMVIIPKSRVNVIRSVKVLDTAITVDDKYKFPIKDTILMPHKVTVERKPYSGSASSKSVSLKSFVTGKGSEDDPYVSADGTAGILEAVERLPKGGTINVPAGYFKITESKAQLPHFVSIKGEGIDRSKFIVATGSALILKGDNTIENITIDITPIEKFNVVMRIDNSAENVTIRNISAKGRYTLKEGSVGLYNVVLCSMMSHNRNILFEQCHFSDVFRSITSKGQKNHDKITIRNCIFDGMAYTPISLDQTSNITNVLIEDNTFRDFSHFGVAFARIANVTLRNNTFYSRTQRDANAPYNQAIHVEDYCQNFLIESNKVDVILGGHQATKPEYRNSAISVVESRGVVIRNNAILNSNIEFADGGNLARNCGYSLVEKNTIDNGAVHIRSSVSHVVVRNNEISNSPEAGVSIIAPNPMSSPCCYNTIEKNSFTGLDGRAPYYMRGDVSYITIKSNSFKGKDMAAPELELIEGAGKGLLIEGNSFNGTIK